MSPITITSAWVKRVIIPMRTLLPTPEPAIKPSLWPQPTVSNALILRTPTSKAWSIGRRFRGLIDCPKILRCSSATMSGPPSSGWPMPSKTRPSIDRLMAVLWVCDCGFTLKPAAMPCTLPNGIKSNFPSPKPTTSATNVDPLGLIMSQ